MMNKEKFNRRIEDNAFLREVVSLHQEICPELRYIQSLWALKIIDRDDKDDKIIDRFYEEPYDTIVRILPMIQTMLLVVEDMYEKNISIKLKISNIKHHLNKLNLL